MSPQLLETRFDPELYYTRLPW